MLFRAVIVHMVSYGHVREYMCMHAYCILVFVDTWRMHNGSVFFLHVRIHQEQPIDQSTKNKRCVEQRDKLLDQYMKFMQENAQMRKSMSDYAMGMGHAEHRRSTDREREREIQENHRICYRQDKTAPTQQGNATASRGNKEGKSLTSKAGKCAYANDTNVGSKSSMSGRLH